MNVEKGSPHRGRVHAKAERSPGRLELVKESAREMAAEGFWGREWQKLS